MTTLTAANAMYVDATGADGLGPAEATLTYTLNQSISEAKELWAAVIETTRGLTAIPKDTVNSFYKNKYATVDDIWATLGPLMVENNLSLAVLGGFDPMIPTNQHGVQTALIFTVYLTHTESGQQLIQDVLVPVPTDTKSYNPQLFGKAQTYLRRYVMVGIFNVTTGEDDDGNSMVRYPIKTALMEKIQAEFIRSADNDEEAAQAAILKALEKSGLKSLDELSQEEGKKWYNYSKTL